MHPSGNPGFNTVTGANAARNTAALNAGTARGPRAINDGAPVPVVDAATTEPSAGAFPTVSTSDGCLGYVAGLS